MMNGTTNTTQKVDPIDGLPVRDSQKDIFDDLESIEVTQAPVQMEVNPDDVDPGMVGEGEELAFDGQQQQEPDSQEQRPWTPQPLPDHYNSPEDAYGAAKYFQSQYDRMVAQTQQYETRFKQYEQIAPVAEAIISDPSLLRVLSNHLSGSSSNGQPAVNPQAPAGGAARESTASLKEPTPPVKPANMDPYSEEYQEYQLAFDRYLDEKANYQQMMLDQRFAKYDSILQEQQQQEEQRRRQIQIEQAKASAINEAMHVHGLSRKEAEQFVNDLATGRLTQNSSALVQAWKLSNAPSANDLRRGQNLEAARMAGGQNRVPMAATQSGQATQQTRSEAQVLGDALEQEYGSQDTWF